MMMLLAETSNLWYRLLVNSAAAQSYSLGATTQICFFLERLSVLTAAVVAERKKFVKFIGRSQSDVAIERLESPIGV